MTSQTPVPSDLDADSFLELGDDCREVAAVLAAVPARVLDLTGTSLHRAVQMPLVRVPLDRLPLSFGAMPAELTDDLLAGTVSGLDDY